MESFGNKFVWRQTPRAGVLVLRPATCVGKTRDDEPQRAALIEKQWKELEGYEENE